MISRSRQEIMQHKMQHKNKEPRIFGVLAMRLTGLEPKTGYYEETLGFIALMHKP